MWRVLVVLAVIGCDQGRKEPPKPKDPYAALVLPEYTGELPAPQTTGALLVVPGGSLDDRAARDGVRIAIDPKLHFADLAAIIDRARAVTDNFTLVVRTPKGVGALHVPLPRATSGTISDADPILVVSVTRDAHIFLGGNEIIGADLEAELRKTPRNNVALAIDQQAGIPAVVAVIAALRAKPDARFLVAPPEPVRMPTRAPPR